MIVDFNSNYENLIDIRTSIEYNKKHVINSINIPRMLLLSEPSKYLDKNKTYYLICQKGLESLSTSKVLNLLGYKCYSINGGINNIKMQ